MPDRPGVPVERTTPDPMADRLAQFKTLFPDVFSERKVDVDKLRTALGDHIDTRPERYSFSWAGKADAQAMLQAPIHATLVPAPDESINFDTTGHVFIEGDNLEVLRLLYKPLFGRVKLIYIDPPYNTGHDFIYPDNFTDPLDTYLRLTGQKDANGHLLTSNPETNGRYHSAWLSMMYPRLWLARQLLRDDGVIFISIDDHEVHNLRLLMNEVFGEENFIAELVWEKGRKNDARFFSVGHEYMIVYSRSVARLREIRTVWREPKPGSREIWEQYLLLRQRFGKNDNGIEEALQEWYRRLQNGHPSKALSRYRHIDRYGPWRDRDISWPGGSGPRYKVIHPITNQPCKIPERGWGFATQEAMQKQIDLGLVVFREDHTEPPFRKAHLRPIPEELDDEANADDINGDDYDSDETQDDEAVSVGMQVMGSYIYKQSQAAVRYLRDLMGAKVFDNPKDHEVLMRIIRYCSSPNSNDIILDFFAGSGSLAEAVLALNREEKGNRRFLLVQLPETTRQRKKDGTFKETPASKAGYNTIADIGKERIRRVIQRLRQGKNGQATLPNPDEDLGFRVFKLAPSQFRPWDTEAAATADGYMTQLTLYAADPLVAGWQPLNLLWEVALKEGYSLSSRIETALDQPNRVYRVTDADSGQACLVCLDDTLDPTLPRHLALTEASVLICRDSALNDELAVNLALRCQLKTI